jgi:hypothetical protein
VCALGHEDREGVEDDERAHDHSQGGEAEEQPGEEVDELADVLVALARDRVRVVDVEARSERPAQ